MLFYILYNLWLFVNDFSLLFYFFDITAAKTEILSSSRLPFLKKAQVTFLTPENHVISAKPPKNIQFYYDIKGKR